jgi:transposase
MRPIPAQTRRAAVQRFLEGEASSKIAQDLGISKSSAKNIAKQELPSRILPKAGRPSKLARREKTYCVHKITRGGKENAVQVAKGLRDELGVAVNPNTVRRALKEAGLGSLEKPKKPLLRAANVRARLEFAKKHADWTIDDWKRVVWSDESKINRFNSDGCIWSWIRDGEDLQPRHVKQTVKHGGGSVMVWGCITYEGTGYLTKIEGNMDKNLYLKILEDELEQSIGYYELDRSKLIFQQDNDPKHKSILAQKHLSEQEYEVIDWPSQSPDLNPIEHIWALVKRRLNKYDRAPKGMLELWERIEHVWNEITKEDCQRVIDSMPTRFQAVIKAKGRWTKY